MANRTLIRKVASNILKDRMPPQEPTTKDHVAAIAKTLIKYPWMIPAVAKLTTEKIQQFQKAKEMIGENIKLEDHNGNSTTE